MLFMELCIFFIEGSYDGNKNDTYPGDIITKFNSLINVTSTQIHIKMVIIEIVIVVIA